MRTLRLVTDNGKLIRVDSSRGFNIKVSDMNTSIVIATNNDYQHNIHEYKFSIGPKCIAEFYDGRQKGLFDISNWFARCWMSACRDYINLRSLRNLEDD